MKLKRSLAWIALGVVLLGCAKSEAPSQTAASEAAAPGAAPAEAPAAPTPPPAEEPATGTAPPTSFEEKSEQAPKAGLSQPERELTTIGEAEKAFEQSNKELEQLIGPLKADKAAGGQAPAPLAGGDARCPRACKAFDSLKRAGDAICRLAGSTDARCSKAKEVVKHSTTRVAACGCKPETD